MTIFFQVSTIGVLLKYILALPSFIMVVNSAPDFEAQKSTSIHHKSTPHGSRGLIKAF